MINGEGGNTGLWGFQNTNGAGTFSWKYDNGTNTILTAILTSGDIASFALDMGAGTLAVYKNNVLMFTCNTSLIGNTVFPFALDFAGSGYSNSTALNFGQQPFTYTPPSGFVALNTYNLPDSTIKQGNKVMDATLYNGNATVKALQMPQGLSLIWFGLKQDHLLTTIVYLTQFVAQPTSFHPTLLKLKPLYLV